MPSATIPTMTPTTPFSPSSNPGIVEVYNFPNTYIQRSRPYLTAAQIVSLHPRESQDEARAIQTRLSACTWIVQVSQALQFPVRTMSTAMILHHRLLLFNPSPFFTDNYTDTAAASLFVACKIEDTLKKSREILAASYNLRHPKDEPINPDSALLEESTKRVIGIERTILETSSFDFRNRHAAPFVVKFARMHSLPRNVAAITWDIAVDVYRTLAALRATPHALALGAMELACRLEGLQVEIQYRELEADRDDVLSIVDELLELYANHGSKTTVGPKYDNTAYLNCKIELNRERKRYANGHGEQGSVQLQHILADRGSAGTIRFMIDPERELKEWEMLEGAADGGMGRAKLRP